MANNGEPKMLGVDNRSSTLKMQCFSANSEFYPRASPDEGLTILLWRYSNRFEARSRAIADRHYNRQKIGTDQFVPPGRCCVFYAGTRTGEAFWVTSWPFAEWVKHAWAGAWVCSAFRNEGAGLASDLIRQAVAATRSVLGEPPELGMITFIDRAKVKATKVRSRDVWGWTYRKAGFVEAGETKGGLLALQLLPDAMPAPARPLLELEASLIGNER
jgi:hypothetical protein